MEHREVTLDDKYDLVEGKAYMTGIQALVRLPLDQKRLDLKAGHNTAGFISGYRGSPLGGYDQQLRAAQAWLDSHDVKFWEGLEPKLYIRTRRSCVPTASNTNDFVPFLF